jgi:hypothetical protein
MLAFDTTPAMPLLLAFRVLPLRLFVCITLHRVAHSIISSRTQNVNKQTNIPRTTQCIKQTNEPNQHRSKQANAKPNETRPTLQHIAIPYQVRIGHWNRFSQMIILVVRA